jgi:hypothetical protein
MDEREQKQQEMREFLKVNGYVGMRAIFKNDRMKCECYLSQSDDPNFDNNERGFMDCLHREEETTQVAMLDNFFFFAERERCEYLTEIPETEEDSRPIEPKAAKKFDKKQQLRELMYDARMLISRVDEDVRVFNHFRFVLEDLKKYRADRLVGSQQFLRKTLKKLNVAYEKIRQAVDLHYDDDLGIINKSEAKNAE